MTPADERAIEAAAEYRRKHTSGSAYAADCACERCMAVRRADIPKALQSDANERWQWLVVLLKRIAR